LGSLPQVLDLYPPGQALWVSDPLASAAASSLWNQLGETGLPVARAQVGMGLELGEGVRLSVLGKAPGRPLALRVEWKSFRALIPLVKPDELPRGCGPAGVLILAPELLKDTPAGEWQAALHPQALLVNGMAVSHPAENLYATGVNGWIAARTDGERLWLEVERR
jgi:hypothetical protein